jgi:hypothetical protein
MNIVNNGTYLELIPENAYLTDLNETVFFERICGKNINPDDYKDISDEEAEEIFKKQEEEESVEIEEGVENNE